MRDQASILPKWLSHQGRILAKEQFHNSYAFWAMPILISSLVANFAHHPLYSTIILANFFFSKSRSFILPNYEQTDSKTAIVLIGIDVTVASTLQFDKNLNVKLENLLLIMNSSFFSIKYVILSFFLDWLTFETVILMIRNFSVVAGNDQRLKQST